MPRALVQAFRYSLAAAFSVSVAISESFQPKAVAAVAASRAVAVWRADRRQRATGLVLSVCGASCAIGFALTCCSLHRRCVSRARVVMGPVKTETGRERAHSACSESDQRFEFQAAVSKEDFPRRATVGFAISHDARVRGL